MKARNTTCLSLKEVKIVITSGKEEYIEKVSVDTEVEASDAKKDGFKEPKNPEEVSVRPVDMPNKGAYPKLINYGTKSTFYNDK